MKILTVPEETEILRRKSRPILKFDKELAEFLRELGETLKGQKDPAGVGLSAIQVGNPIRVFATFLPETENNEHPPAGEAGKTMSNEEKTKNKKQKTKIVFYINPEIAEHAEEMTLGAPKESCFAPEASGLALAKSDPSGFGRTSGFLQGKNPGPSEKNREEKPFLEGCLSIPRIYGAVMRYPWIRAKATAVNGDLYYPGSGRCEYNRDLFSEFKFKLEGLAARVFQHELDHLNGILFTDHVLAQGNQLFRETGREMIEMEM